MTLSIWIALIRSLAGQVGGKIGGVVTLLMDAFDTIDMSIEDIKTKVEPWVEWINAIIVAQRDLTDAEHQAVVDCADAVRANNASLATGGPGVAIPAPPTA